jgi:DNA-binding XRE family transcriptional regulator
VTLLKDGIKYGLGLPIGVRVVRKCAIPKPIAPKSVTLGQHLKQYREKCKLRQKDVAVTLGVGHFTYMTWEKDQATPFPRYYPKIIAWLGYDPLPKPQTEGEALRQARWRLGLTSQQMADVMDCDQGTLLAGEASTKT